MTLPNAYLASLRPLLGEAWQDFVQAMDAPATPAMHLNSLRQNAQALMASFLGDPVPWAEDCYYVSGGQPGATPWHDLGACYLQEASAMAPAGALNPQPGERVLDLCAAPGGKSFQLACRMRGEGMLICNEPVPARAKVLAENLERLGVVNAVAVNAYPQDLSQKWPETFDAILVDAPCSGEGMFRRTPKSAEQWKSSLAEGCARRQSAILEEAAAMLKPGGRMVYSTCTFNDIENEGVIEAFLKKHPECCAEEFSLPGVGTSSGGMLRLWPHLLRGEGHFVTKLRKNESSAKRMRSGERKKAGSSPGKSRETKDDRELLRRLEEDICRLPAVLSGGDLLRQADYIHMLPENTPPLDGIRLAKPGLCLMRAGRSHIQPMPALARACSVGASLPHLARAKREIALSEEEYRRMRLSGFEKPYLRESGWVLYTLASLPVCFIKGGPVGTYMSLY